jgi:DNA-directed RNA polymerase specialized sigma24 family protein
MDASGVPDNPWSVTMDVGPSSPSLDLLATHAREGDAAAESRMLGILRERFLALAKRRVRDEDREDVTQDALGIVLAKYRGRESARGTLPWSLAVLRHVIGNHYQRRGARAGHEPIDEQLAARDTVDPLDPLLAEERVARVRRAMERLAAEHPRCGRLMGRVLESLAAGGTPAETSRRTMAGLAEAFPGTTPNAIYVMLHRCRARLRRILEPEGGA